MGSTYLKLLAFFDIASTPKFILHVRDEATDSTTEIAFLDVRRLGRIRLVKSPLEEPPISTLGFDPILSMPKLEDFKPQVLKRSCPIKALLLDQSFSAGVGNWVAGEITDNPVPRIPSHGAS